MSAMTLAQASASNGGLYVPRFELRIEGAGLPQNVLRDVTQVTYHDDIKRIDAVEIQVNNWDEQAGAFKYIGSETSADLNRSDERGARFRLFEPAARKFQLYLGYESELQLMMTGSFTTMEPSFPSSGAPTLRVRGLNVLHQLRKRQYTTRWEDKSESEIVDRIQNLRDRETGEKRFPLPIEIDENAKSDEEPIKFLAQENQYDIDFIMSLARRRGYEVAIREDDEEKRLYFGPSGATFAKSYVLEWGKSLLEYRPTFNVSKQIRSVTVHGWNREDRTPIRETVTLGDRRFDINADLNEVVEQAFPREENVVTLPVFTPQEARRRAEAILRERQKDLLRASGTTVGLPSLRAGRTVEIGGLGARLSGRYYVTDTTHTIGPGGYVTQFNARREETR